jgi:hypothetical protein
MVRFHPTGKIAEPGAGEILAGFTIGNRSRLFMDGKLVINRCGLKQSAPIRETDSLIGIYPSPIPIIHPTSIQ